MRHQMKFLKRDVNPEDKASQCVNLQDPDATVKACDEAFEQRLQAARGTLYENDCWPDKACNKCI